jgi:glucose/arabinose dehydrogenase
LPGIAPSRPPRLPPAPGSKLALASDLGTGIANPSVVRNVIADGLEVPTDIAVAADGTLFFTERRKGLSVQRVGQATSKLFAPADLEPGPGTSGGMRAVAVDPRFAANRHLYVLMRSNAEGRPAGRVVRLTLDSALAAVIERRDIVVIADAAPAVLAPPATAASAPPAAERHLGGVLRFGADGHLYVAVGDARLPHAAQATGTLHGKVLRVDREGAAAADARPPPGHDPRVYAVGLREPVAIGFHPASQELMVAQRRGAQADEVVLLTRL